MWIKLKSDVHKQIDYLQGTFEETKQTTGISCLSESDSSLLMWRIMRITIKECVFNTNVRISEQLKFSPIPVIYTDEGVSLNSLISEDLRRDTMKFFVESVTTKSPEWSYEKEWR